MQAVVPIFYFNDQNSSTEFTSSQVRRRNTPLASNEENAENVSDRTEECSLGSNIRFINTNYNDKNPTVLEYFKSVYTDYCKGNTNRCCFRRNSNQTNTRTSYRTGYTYTRDILEENDFMGETRDFESSLSRNMEHMFKLLVIGDPGIGKTSLVQYYAYSHYPKDYKMTIGGKYFIDMINNK